ncbi:MAG: THUMP domain-containing protein, partial [Burkholderiaceae bacterium]
MSYSFFCPCPRGLEDALADELSDIALHSRTLKIHNKVPGGVHCSGTLQDAMLLNLHSRIASRVLLRITQSSYSSEDDVFKLALSARWEDWFDTDCTIRVDVNAIKSPLKSLDFVTLRIKDAVC